MNGVSEKTRDPHAELFCYEQKAALENKERHPEIARYWEKAALAAKMCADASSFFGKINDRATIPLACDAKESFSAAQISAKYIAHSLKAMAAGNLSLAQQWAEAAERFKEAHAHYEYWTRRIHQEALEAHSIKESEALKIMLHYRAREAEAGVVNNRRLMQQWAEAACLAQEALHKVKKTELLFSKKENPLIIHAFLMAAYWTKKAASLRAKVAEAVERGNKKEIQHASTIAMAAEDAATYRSKAARTIRLEDKSISHYWTMAAYWAANSSSYQQEEGSLWIQASILAKRISRAYAAAAKNKIAKRPSSLVIYCWLKCALRAEQKVKKVFQKILEEHALVSTHSSCVSLF